MTHIKSNHTMKHLIAMLGQLQINRSRSVCCNKSLTPWKSIQMNRLHFQSPPNFINHSTHALSAQMTWTNINCARWNWAMVSDIEIVALIYDPNCFEIVFVDAPKGNTFECKMVYLYFLNTISSLFIIKYKNEFSYWN